MKRLFGVLVLAPAVALISERLPAQTTPRLADYFTTIPLTVLDAGYVAQSISPVTADVDGDGNEDLIVLGAWHPGEGRTCCTPQPGRVFLGDGDGHFSPAPANLFPVDTLLTVLPRKVLFADFNADGRQDMFISSHGWDAPPFPGEQDRLYLSRPAGGWRDATDSLPQISDSSHTSAAGDISGRGLIDIFVGNGYGSVGPYFLLNTGSGQFTQMRTDPSTAHPIAGATLADLDGDGRADLIVTAGGPSVSRTTILWNRAGIFTDADTTPLPEPRVFATTHRDVDVQRIDVNQDGLPDLLLVGSQGNPDAYDGWFVQILLNKGNRRFVDETALRVPLADASRGREGLRTNAPWPMSVRVIDFNRDGAPDFAVDFHGNGSAFAHDEPVVWLNDGAGHFSTLKAGDFVPPGDEALVLGGARLMRTRHGYSFIEPRLSPKGGLMLTGLLAIAPLRTIGPSPDLSASSSVSRVAGSWRPGTTSGADPSPLSPAANGTTLIFDRPPAQGPGTPGFQTVSDPTIQPILAPGMPAPTLESASIDLQGNGRPDVVVCHGSFPPLPDVKGPCRVLRPQPDGSLVDVTRQLFGSGALPSSTHPREILSGDFNHDGRGDIFIAAHGYDTAPFPGETNLLLISNPDGTYADRSATLPQAPDFTHSACVADINVDGNLDIFVNNQSSDGAPVGPYFLMGRGDGTFTQRVTGLPATFGGGDEKFASCLLVDLDQDRRDDLVLATTNPSARNIVLFNDGTGDFSRRPRVELVDGPLPQNNRLVVDIASLDVNLDGRPDLLMLSTATQGANGVGLQLLMNHGNGTLVDESARLGPPVARVTGPWFEFIRLTDFNGDGLPDLYLERRPGRDSSISPCIWLNNGDGTLTPIAPSALPPELSLQTIFSVDFDGDRRPDIALGVGGSGSSLTYRSFLNRTPVVTSNVSFPPRNEVNDFNTQLENLYRDRLGAPVISAYVDLEGANVWLTEYARYRVGQCGHADATSRVFAQINAGVTPRVCGLTPVGAIPFPPRNEGFDFMIQLDVLYRDRLRRSPSMVYVNNEGRVVWILEYLRYRLNRCGHADATTRVFQQILGQGIQPTCG